MTHPVQPVEPSDGAMERASLSFASTGVVATVALLCLAVETLLLAAVLDGGPVTALAGHGAVLLLTSAWAWHPSCRVGRYPVLLWMATATFGPFGPAGVLLTMALERHYARHATDVEAWHAMLFPPTQVDEHAELWRRIGQRASDVPAHQQVTPFLDILAFGSVPQRQSALAIIAQQFHPAFAPALEAALRDPHNVIRVQAATAIARIENDFLERTLQLEDAVRETPNDTAVTLALASHYDDQAFAGLLDGTREQDCRVKAADGYEQYLRQHPEDEAVRFRLGRLQQRRGLSGEAERLFRPLVASGYPGARQWLMESLFEQGAYAELRGVAAAETEAAGSDVLPEVASTVDLWAGREVEA